MNKSMKTEDKISPDQRRFLLGEIAKHYRQAYEFRDAKLPPELKAVEAQIATLEKRIEVYQTVQKRAADNQFKEYQKAMADARQEVYFGTAGKALAALENIRKRYPAK